MNQLTWDSQQFYLDGAPFQIHSAAMHYFRILPEYWYDRLKKVKDCGFNTIETYTCWNLHERREGEFDFSGLLDLRKYLSIANELGLKVILRPGPYICGEWEGGGLPSWLIQVPNMALRCNNPAFLEKLRNYLAAVMDQVRPLLGSNGGPIMMVQVENEYGSYGNDKQYLRAIADIYRSLGVQDALFTSDGTSEFMLNGGTLPEILSVANFGSHPKEEFSTLKKFKPDQPLMCGEFWCGWFDHWYEEHHTRTSESLRQDVQEMLNMGASFNIYMFHGGTNFGFWNGANHGGVYEPIISSYDYSAPLAEDGSATEGYYALQELLCKDKPQSPAPVRHEAYGTISLSESVDLLDMLPRISKPVTAAAPMTFEQLGLDFGYVLYRTTLQGAFEELPLEFGEIHDRAHIYLNGKLMKIVERDRMNETFTLSLPAGATATLDILVENMGRVNYGEKLLDAKGIIGGVRLGLQHQFGWEMWCLPMDHLENLQFQSRQPEFTGPAQFLRGKLTVDGQPADTYLHPQGLSKGFISVNGFNIGRYYNAAGPQKSLYLPAPLLHSGDNEIIVFETDGICPDTDLLVSKQEPDLG